MASLVEDLCRGALEMRETHISWVFLHEHLVFKDKKPVNFGFLDFSSVPARRRACEAEVALNRRLAPDVYLGVAPVRLAETGHEICFGGDAASVVEHPVDWAVCMRRLPDADSAQARLERGELSPEQLRGLAHHLARFHARSPRAPEIDEHGKPDRVRRNVTENFEQAHSLLRPLVSEAQQREVEAYQLEFLSARADLFEQRIAQGRIVDGHGDLKLEHVYFDADAAPTIIDCIEFNERFRRADVCADVAFLSMDLAWRDRAVLGEGFLSAYALEANDYDLYALVDFYQSYRAYVRTKVTALSLSTRSLADNARRRLEQDARSYFQLARAAARPTLAGPRRVGVGGLIASGKSTLSRALADATGAVRIGSDRTRKWLMGVEASQSLRGDAFAGGYAEETTARVYAELLRRAEVVLGSGRSVIVDASFRTREARALARALARRRSASFHFLECRAPDEVVRHRLEQRARGHEESDARLDLLESFRARFEAVSELPASEHLVLDTSRPLAALLSQLERDLDWQPEAERPDPG
jgi:aminoglycoside phosphotransferase family enzyme/predicted kinase